MDILVPRIVFLLFSSLDPWNKDIINDLDDKDIVVYVDAIDDTIENLDLSIVLPGDKIPKKPTTWKGLTGRSTTLNKTHYDKIIGPMKAGNVHIRQFINVETAEILARTVLYLSKIMDLPADKNDLVTLFGDALVEGKGWDFTNYKDGDSIYVGKLNDFKPKAKLNVSESKDDDKGLKDDDKSDQDTNPSSYFNPEDINGIVKMIDYIDPAVKYQGFDPKGLRKRFLQSEKKDIDVVKNLLLCFTAYAHIGNHLLKLQVKRVDIGISVQVLDLVNNLSVKKKTSTSTGFTLPRIAIAFMPEYFIYRKFITRDLQPQTSSQINVEYKDICFYGYDRIQNLPGYKDFHKQFSALIYNPRVKIALDNKDFLNDLEKWCEVSVTGFMQDTLIHNNMNAAMNTQGLSVEQASMRILQSVSDMRITHEALYDPLIEQEVKGKRSNKRTRDQDVITQPGKKSKESDKTDDDVEPGQIG